MGVLNCDRQGCRNFMCDRLSHKYGYICRRCFDQLKAAGPGTDIAAFMGQEPRRDFSQEAWEAMLEALFERK